MQTTFQIDEKKKTRLHKDYLHAQKGMMVIWYGLLIIMAVFTIVFSYYGLVRQDTFLGDWYDRDLAEKNYLFVWTVLITVNVILFFLWIIQYIVSKHILTGKYFSQRINERLCIGDAFLEYSYQNAVGSKNGDRVVVRMPLGGLEEILLDKNFQRIEFVGDYNSAYYENYHKKITRADVDHFQKGSLILHDYFVPGLAEYVRERFGAYIRENR